MKNRKLFLFIIFGVVIVASLGVMFIARGKDTALRTGAVEYKEYPVRLGTFRLVVSASGLVQPIDRIELKSKASGVVVELPVEEGDFVHKGDLIAKLDQKDEKAAYEQAKANLDIARAEIKQAQRTYDRRDQLFQKGLVSEEELGQIELNLATAKGKLVQANTTLERATERLSEAIVRAPIDGIILQKYVEEGQIIASGINNVSGGTPIADIAAMSSVYIEAGVDEIDIGKIKAGQAASVVADAYPQLTFRGKIVRIAPEAIVEQNVTLFHVIIEVENTNGKLKSGMNASVEIAIVEKENVLLAPALTLKMPERRSGNKRNIRFAMLKEGTDFKPRKVEVGMSNFKQTVILSGLKEGDVLGVPMMSRLKQENERLQQRIKKSRSFGS